MDDTTQSRTSDVAASAATRKRRSSILKSQRPPRTPFCELEFNVLTPTDTTKSRRVSFSKRTGVAEFATNEATTTWKNFYEEHNKSLESSGNDSAMNHFKQPIGHIGKRVFEQQFEEVEAVDFMRTLNPGVNISSSINHINFGQVETTEPKLIPLQSKFELSAFTETQSKLFGNNLAVTCEASGCIDGNFSSIQQIGEKDDLDDIQQDLKRNSNVVCQGPITGQDLSEYIEVDLNTTHISIYNNESNMSITDTIHSPQVQEVSKSCSIDKKININNKDWVTDKENIVLNPYIAPRESVNFAVTEMPNEVFVFDGKKLIVETENPKKEVFRQSVLPNPSEQGSQRKTIVINCNDDLPNFIEDAQFTKNLLSSARMPEMQQSYRQEDKPVNHHSDVIQNKCNTIFFDHDLNDISITQAAPKVIPDVVKRQTIIYNDNIGNMSMTQAIPSNFINKENNVTIVYGNNIDISITQAVPANVVIANKNEKRKTILFDNETCNISMTEAIPTNILPDNSVAKRKIDPVDKESVSNSISNPKNGSQDLSQTDNIRNISTTLSQISTNSPDENVRALERKTTVEFGNDVGNISVTQALPSNTILPQKLNDTTYGNSGNISMTQAIPSNILLGKSSEANKLTTVASGDDTENLSITQAVKKNQIIVGVYQNYLKVEGKNIDISSSKSFYNNDISYTQDPSLNQALTQRKLSKSAEEITRNKRQTIVFQNKDADISITQSVPIGQIIDNIHLQNQNNEVVNLEISHEVFQTESSTSKRRTVVFDNDEADISLTQAISANRVIDTQNVQKQEENYYNSVASASENPQLTINEEEKHDFPSTNIILNKEESSNRTSTVIFDNNESDICMTEPVFINEVIDTMQNKKFEAHTASGQGLNKIRTLVSDKHKTDIANVTHASSLKKVIDATRNENQSTALVQESTNKRRTVVFENDDANISVTQAVTMNKVIDSTQKENQSIGATNALSMIQTIPLTQIIETVRTKHNNDEETCLAIHEEEIMNKAQTEVFVNDDTDTSMSRADTINQVFDNIQNKIIDFKGKNVSLKEGTINKRRTGVFKNDESELSVIEAVPKNQVNDINNKENQNFKAFTALRDELNVNEVLFVNDGAIISTNTAVNQVIHRQEYESKQNSIQNEYDDENKTIHYENAISVKTPHIVYDDDEAHISMTLPVSSSIILPDGQEKRRTIVVESVESLLENKDLLIEIDKLGDSANVNISEIEDQDEGDISMIDFSETEFKEKDVIKCEDNNVYVTKLIRESFSPNKQDKPCVNITEPSAMLSKPIPASLAAIQHRIADKQDCQDLKFDSTLLNTTKTLTDVLVYQSMTANTQDLQTKTNKRDSIITSGEEKLNCDEKEDSSQSFTVTNSEIKVPKPEQVDSQHESNIDLVTASNSNHSTLKAIDSKPNNSILNELLDMSESYIEGRGDKDLMSEVNSTNGSVVQATNSTDAMFYITKDPDEDDKISEPEVISNTQVTKRGPGQIESENPLCIEYKDDDEPPILRDVQRKLSTIKNVLRENHTSQFKPSRNEIDEVEGSKVSLDMSKRNSSKSVKIANDTNELLEMLSDFSDTGRFKNSPEKIKEKNVVPESLMPIKNAIDPKKHEPLQSNRSLKRQSAVLSREDLLNNMSMASAVLQKSRFDFDESDHVEEVTKTPDVTKRERKSVKLSTDVVKTLQFDDDSITEKTESISTPLKKTAFGEISYMKETKSKVIPSFMNEVCDGIKELMDDLVKPTPDVQHFKMVPFERHALKTNASTCSTQIQANLLASSQIDLNTELYSTTNSTSDMNKLSSADIITDAVNRSMTRALKSPEKSTPIYTQSIRSSEIKISSENKSVKIIPPTKPSSRQFGSVLVFDQLNPLNNVLLAATPVHAIDIHRYDPIGPNDKTDLQSIQTEDSEQQEERVTDQYRVEVEAAVPVTQHENATKTDTSGTSLASKPMSVDQSTELDFNNTKDAEINTVIAMKRNEQLLKGSSSLTLVEDDEAAQNNVPCPPDAVPRDTASSLVEVIFRTNEPSLTKVNSDRTDNPEPPLKRQKRVYSMANREKHKHCTLSSLELTPIPAMKIHKREDEEPTKLEPERDNTPGLEKEKSSRQHKSSKRRSKKPGTTVTVQQLTTMVHVDGCGDEEAGRSETSTSEPRSANGSRSALGASSSEVSSSFASSNNWRGPDSLAAPPPAMEWAATSRPHLHNACYGDDVMGLLDAMPFMGSEDCQWESVSGPAWSLLLLHARLRLSVVFAHAHPRHNTPVLNIQLETLRQDKKNPIAHLCVTYAAEVMRYHMERGCAVAGDVGQLVRRVAGVARLAAQWARAMYEARVRLAYSLTHDGWLTLKVANTSYRTVWEVVMRLELVVEKEHASPWPRAGDVRVARALAAPLGAPPPPDVTRALAATPRDWGHAPRTIWKVFRYLKHMKRDDDFLQL